MLKRLLPDRLSHSLIAVVVGGILLTQAFALGVYRLDRARVIEAAESNQAATCLAGFANILASETPQRRWEILRPLLPKVSPEERRAIMARGQQSAADLVPGSEFDIHLPLWPDLPANSSGEMGARSNSGMHSVIEVNQLLPDGTNLKLSASPAFGSQFFTLEFVAYMGAVLVVGILGSIWAIALATMPLRRLSGAADSFGTDVNATPVPEDGPREVRQAATAFNRMQHRLRQFIVDRTRMLAAISHDLRTPLTRVRLRAELMEEEEDREKMLADIDEMDQMIQTTLAFARDDNASETSEKVDLRHLLQMIVAEAVEAVGDHGRVTLEPSGTVPVRARPQALKRAIVNVIENALRYAKGGIVKLERAGDEISISVIDHGPGIVPSERENVLQPFYRCDDSRSRDTGGAGLGLTIANDIVRAHGGRLLLHDTPGGGLTVEMRLPAA